VSEVLIELCGVVQVHQRGRVKEEFGKQVEELVERLVGVDQHLGVARHRLLGAGLTVLVVPLVERRFGPAATLGCLAVLIARKP
jgi:hypothetical protein